MLIDLDLPPERAAAALRDAARAAILAKLDEPDALARSGPHASN
jgi:hypothetical protein